MCTSVCESACLYMCVLMCCWFCLSCVPVWTHKRVHMSICLLIDAWHSCVPVHMFSYVMIHMPFYMRASLHMPTVCEEQLMCACF